MPHPWTCQTGCWKQPSVVLLCYRVLFPGSHHSSAPIMLASSVRPQSVCLRGGSAVRNGRGTSLPRVTVLRRCTSANAPDAPKQQPLKAAPKTGLVMIAGGLHLRINAINVNIHLKGSTPLQAGQQEMATMLQSAVMDAATAAVAARLADSSRELAPIALASPFTCYSELMSPAVNALAMCSDGHHFVCGYEDGDVALWDVRKPGQRVVADICKLTIIQSVAASADGRRVLVGGVDGLWLWDVQQGKVTALLHEDNEEDEQHKDVWRVAITPDGRYGASGGYNQGLRVWDLEEGECIGSVGTIGRALDVVISPDGQTAAAVVVVKASNDSEDDSEDVRGVGGHQVWRWHAGSGFSKPVKLQGCPQEAEISMSADGGVVLSVDAEGVVQRWDRQSGKGEAVFTQPGRVSRLALSPDGRRALVGIKEGILSVWDVEGKACLAALHGHKGRGVDDAAISADGRYAVSYNAFDDRLCMWHLG